MASEGLEIKLETNSGINIVESFVMLYSHSQADQNEAIQSGGRSSPVMKKIRGNTSKIKEQTRVELSELYKTTVLCELANYFSNSEGGKSFYKKEIFERFTALNRELQVERMPTFDLKLRSPDEVERELRIAKDRVINGDPNGHGALFGALNKILESIPKAGLLVDLKGSLPKYGSRKYLETSSICLADLNCYFTIDQSGMYDHVISTNIAFRIFQDVFNPTAGYIRITSPNNLQYAFDFLQKSLKGRTLVPFEQVSIKKMHPFNYFRKQVGK